MVVDERLAWRPPRARLLGERTTRATRTTDPYRRRIRSPPERVIRRVEPHLLRILLRRQQIAACSRALLGGVGADRAGSASAAAVDKEARRRSPKRAQPAAYREQRSTTTSRRGPECTPTIKQRDGDRLRRRSQVGCERGSSRTCGASGMPNRRARMWADLRAPAQGPRQTSRAGGVAPSRAWFTAGARQEERRHTPIHCMCGAAASVNQDDDSRARRNWRRVCCSRTTAQGAREARKSGSLPPLLALIGDPEAPAVPSGRRADEIRFRCRRVGDERRAHGLLGGREVPSFRHLPRSRAGSRAAADVLLGRVEGGRASTSPSAPAGRPSPPCKSTSASSNAKSAPRPCRRRAR